MIPNNMLDELASLSIGEIVNTLSNAYINLILNNKNFSLFPSVMLWGQPGVGKSQAIRQIAKEIETKTDKKVFVTDVRLLLFNPIDLRGIPVANEEKTLAVWLKPKIFQMNESPECVNILFLDEISAAPQSVQSAAYQITLDRTVGEHRLPKNCLVIAAGNRTTDKSVAYKMPSALANRLLHFEVDTDFESWKKWAIQNEIDQKVIGFLAFKPDMLNTYEANKDLLAFATPRSWEMVSNLLKHINSNIDEIFNLVVGLIGKGPAIVFRTWLKVFNELPNVDDIFNGKEIEVPKEQSAIYALSTSLVEYLETRKPDMEHIENSVRYISKFPREYALMIFEDYALVNKEFETNLTNIKPFREWLRANADTLTKETNDIFCQN